MNQRPRHSVAVSAFVRHKGKALLVKTHFRSDTWEIPGGIVQEGEPLHEAVCREVRKRLVTGRNNGCILGWIKKVEKTT